jgi:hypothetical protein
MTKLLPSRTTKNKIKISLTIDKTINKEILRTSKLMKMKRSLIINKVLREFFFNEYFETADKLINK